MTETHTEFLAKISRRSSPSGDCLTYQGTPSPNGGHPLVSFNGRRLPVSRAAYIARHGELTADKPHVLHHCDVPSCWREEHLYAGTPAENARDRTVRGRRIYTRSASCAHGHALDDENTYHWCGSRICRACNRNRKAQSRARQKEKA